MHHTWQLTKLAVKRDEADHAVRRIFISKNYGPRQLISIDESILAILQLCDARSELQSGSGS